MNYSFSQYLLSKQSVDDRAINRPVLETLREAIASSQSLSICEVGGGIGTMPARLLRWNLLPARAHYTLIDEMTENITFARRWLPTWAAENGVSCEAKGDELILTTPNTQLTLRLVASDIFDFARNSPPQADLLIAHAFLDLLPLPSALGQLFSLAKPGALAWLTLNFDGVTSLEPTINPKLDARIEQFYHQTMDERPGGGDHRTGRHLFAHLAQTTQSILAAGASDWIVYPQNGRYPANEAYFLHFILHFFQETLEKHPGLDPLDFAHWIATRNQQIDQGQLVYIAHQTDFLVRTLTTS